MHAAKIDGYVVDVGDDRIRRKVMAQVRADVLGQFSVTPTDEQRGEETSSAVPMDRDHGVHVFDERGE